MNYSTLSLSELKALATANNVVPTGDKRSKKAWIDALESVALYSTIETWIDTAIELVAAQTTTAEPTDSEMECAAVAVDMAADIWTDESALAQTVEPAPATPQPAPAVEEVLHRKSDKKGAATVFGSLLCILILTIQAVLCIGCVIVQAAIHLKNLFGSYNPDYDLLGRLQDMVRQRKASPAKQAQQPAY